MSRPVEVGEEWKGCGQSDGLEIWRIENKVPTPIPKEDYGKFYSGDSYIVLKTTVPQRGPKQWDLFFWLGEETTADESGIAAYKTVELDEYLGGGPVQHRETEGHESPQFLAAFKPHGGIQYLEGGVDSAFNKVEPDKYEPRLLHLKGKRNVRARQVPLKRESLNEGDVFILDNGLKLYLWNGKDANRFEKAKGVQLLVKLRNERGARPETVLLDEDPENEEFWSMLGGQGPIASAEEGGEDEVADSGEETKLFRVSDASGTLETTPVEKVDGKLTKDMLDEDDVFILDADTTLYVWVGRGATTQERREGMKTGQDYLAQAGKPAHTPVTRVVQNAEPEVFKSHFAHWDPPRRPANFARVEASGIAKTQEQREIDIDAMAAGALGSREDEQVLQEGGEITIWRIEDMEKAEWPKERYGEFYGGDSYIILYKYRDSSGREQAVIYFWQGRHSSNDEKGASALLATHLADELGGSATQVRVVQGKEPSHFRSLFKGHMVIHAGGKASGFRNRDDGDSYDTDGVSLFHVKGTNQLNTMAVQVEEEAKSLNSGDCFVLLTPSTMYEWHGTGANNDECEVAHNVAQRLCGEREHAVVTEGEEPDAFWEALGGKAEYPSEPELQEQPKEPRLFQCSNATGTFAVEEVFDFSQDDLQDDDVMLLDVYTQLFVWVGSGANETEKRMSKEVAENYVSAAASKDGRDPSIPIVVVQAGREPPMFTCHFLGWDADAAQRFEDPYERRKRLLEEEKQRKREEEEAKQDEHAVTSDDIAAKTSAGAASGAAASTATASPQGFFTYEELKGGIPPGMDPTAKETYLSDEDFKRLFECTKSEFKELKPWRQKMLKKGLGLF